MSDIAWPALLAGAAAAVAVGLPGPGQARLAALSHGRPRPGGLRGGPGLGAAAAATARAETGLAGLGPPGTGPRALGGAGLPRTAGSRSCRSAAGAGAAGPGAAGPGAAGPGPAGHGAAGARSGDGTAGALPAGTRPAAAAAALSLAYLSGSLVVLLLAVGTALVGQAAWRRHREGAAATAERLAAGEACLALAAELRAGRSPAEALATAADLARGPCRASLLTAAAAARLGGDVPAALASGVAGGSSAPELLRGLAACWQVCARAGSGLAGAVDRLAEGLRSAQVQEQAVQAALAGPRASAGLLAVLPLAGIGLAAGLGAQPLHVLLHTPVGVACLLAGVGLDVLGLWWTGRIVARAGRGR